MPRQMKLDEENDLFWALDRYWELKILYGDDKKLAIYNRGVIATGDSVEELSDKVMDMKAKGFPFEGCVITISCSDLEKVLTLTED